MGMFFLFSDTIAAEPYLPKPRNEEKLKDVTAYQAEPYLQLKGNVIFDEKKVIGVLALDGSQPISEDELKEAVGKLTNFYHQDGYALANVRYEKAGEGWLVRVDEGTLSSILVFGLGWHAGYVLRNTILPNDVYNEHRLREQLARWAEKKKRYDVRFELQVLEKDAKKPLSFAVGFVRKLLPTSRTLRALQAGGVYNLYIYFTPKPGVSLGFYDMEYTLINGLKLDGEVVFPGTLLKNDRFSLGVRFGFVGHESIQPGRAETRYFTTGGGSLRWFTPPLGVSWLRLGVEGEADRLSDQRPDLPLERYEVVDVAGNLKLRFNISRKQNGALWVGYNYKNLHEHENVSSAPFTPNPSNVHALVGGLSWTQIIGERKPDLRLNHTFELESWASHRRNRKFTFFATSTHRKVFPFSWLDIETKGTGALLEGGAEFYEELPLHELADRASFNRTFFVRRVFTQTTEFRLKLHERKLQLGVFNDASVFGRINRTTGNQKATFADGFGPLLDLVIYDAFRFRFAYAFGVSTADLDTHEFYFGVSKVL